MDIQTATAVLKLLTLDLLKTNDESAQGKKEWSGQLAAFTRVFQEAVPEMAADATHPETLADKLYEKDFDEKDVISLTVDLLNWPLISKESKPEVVESAKLEALALIGIDDESGEYFLELKKSAEEAHRKVNWLKAGAIGVGGAAVLALGGWFAAPIIGGAVGAAMGLSGAAATSAGLAFLGGGSLAAGGAGMAGGVWLMTAVGAAAGAGLSGTVGAGISKDVPAALYRFGVVTQQMVSVAMFELLQDEQGSKDAARRLFKEAELIRDELRKVEAHSGDSEEREKQVKELKLKLQANLDGRQWIRERLKS